MARLRKLLIIWMVVLAALAGALTAAWALDARSSRGEAMRNVSLAGRNVGGRPSEEVSRLVADAATRFEAGDIRVQAPRGGFRAAAAELGTRVDRDATVTETLDVGRDDPWMLRGLGWLASFLDDRDAPIELTIDEAALRSTVARLDRRREAPVEPSVELRGQRLVAVDGKAGHGIDHRDVLDELRDEAGSGRLPTMLEVDRGRVAPRYSLADAERLARRGEELTTAALRVAVEGLEATVAPESLRAWVRAFPGDRSLELRLDPTAVQNDLAKLFPEVGRPPVDASFRVEGAGVRVVAGQTGTGCCTEEAPAQILDALLRGERSVTLSLRTVQPALTNEQAQALRIVEKVGEFTTRHAAGEARVRNIHRIADLVRGVVIKPGETFSVNGFVGRRTRARGFVEAGVIERGRFTTDVGGGISQFATTTFNAAFFAGLDFGEYQSHSIYISRYPYGREATLSFPHPDLQLINRTPYGALIWTRYTESTITVEIWSTRWSPGQQTAQTRGRRGRCTRVTTERTRTFVSDGHTEKDQVFATYRPAEGVNC